MASPKHYPTFKVAQTEALAKLLTVTQADGGGLLCKGYGRIDSTAASDDYFVQFLNHEAAPVDGDSIANGRLTFIASPIAITHTNGVHSLFTFDFGPEYVKSRHGIFIALSTTEYSHTLVTADVLTATAFHLN